jgi:glycosyltransferase involved in cell wall biosynthesis
VFLNVASIHGTKAQVPAVLALARLLETHPHARLVLLGPVFDPAYRRELARQIDRRGLGHAVVFAGQSHDPARFYRMADAFLLPSYWEGWSLALNEALAAGLPVVATEVGAAADLITPDLGRLVRPPFRSVSELDCGSLHRLVTQHDPRFIADLAEGMRSACANAARTTLPTRVRERIDQGPIHAFYADLFAWLVQGGAPDAVRIWAQPRLGAFEPAAQVGGSATAA